MSDLPLEDEFEVENNELIEIDYSDYGFFLRSRISEYSWKLIPEDPDMDPIDIINDWQAFPIQWEGRVIEYDDFCKFEELRKSLI